MTNSQFADTSESTKIRGIRGNFHTYTLQMTATVKLSPKSQQTISKTAFQIDVPSIATTITYVLKKTFTSIKIMNTEK